MRRPALRSAVRRLREAPVVGAVVRAADRLWWWRVIRRSPLVDADFYAAQLGLRRLPRDAVIAHYVTRGFRRGLSVNPLFDEITAGGHLPEVFRVPAMYAYLLSDKTTVPVHPLWDAPAVARSLPGGGSAPLETAWAGVMPAVELATGGRAQRWTVTDVRDAARRDARGWRRPDRVRVHGGAGPTDEDTLIVRVVQKRDRRYGVKLRQAAEWALRADTRVTVALISPDASQWVAARLLARLVPELEVVGHSARTDWSRVVGDAVGSRGVRALVVLDPRAEVDDGDIAALEAAALAGRAAGPVEVSGDGVIAGAGAALVPGFRESYRILRGHPTEDLAGWGIDPVVVPSLTGRTAALPGALVRAVLNSAMPAGADPLQVWTRQGTLSGMPSIVLPSRRSLHVEPEYAFAPCRRERAQAPAGPDETVRAEELLQSAGFSVDGWRADAAGRPEPRLQWRRPAPDVERWAIKICAPPGRAGAVWGDTHFAHGLAKALGRRGHTVIIDAFGSARRPSAYLDDVSVVIRGPYRIEPPDTGVRLEWIISHPDQITPAEIAAFDGVFAASRRWSEAASRRFGVPIEPLLECTDVDQFEPAGLPRGDDVVFVGTARGIARPSVVAPLAAGIPVKVYGPDWRPFIPSSAVAAETLPNAELPARYETASIVLNDQWPAMREQGFIAMRPFDAVAVGGRVISEDVDEIEEIFRGAVVTYRDADHLVELLRSDPASIFPSDEELHRIAAYVRREHSFDARAAVLQDAADRLPGAGRK